MPISCHQIADYFIWLANETGSHLSNLKLQKLVYYAQAWHLAIEGEELFLEDFEAWVYGPVIPSLWNIYKDFGQGSITKDFAERPSFGEEIDEFLDEVADVYFGIHAFDLAKLTHTEKPWLEARKGLAPDELSNNIISKESMKKFYSERLEEED